jgi:predicted dehydrogenase
MIPKIGVIGGGIFGEMHLRAFNQLQREGKAELVGLADINQKLLVEREKQYGVAGFEATVNQGIRIVGCEGMMEVDSQNRGAESCFAVGGMASYNLGFFKEEKTKSGETRYSGYGIASIQDFAFNVDHLLNGGKLSDLEGSFADGRDGLEVTKIAAGVHQSLETGAPVKLSGL